MAQMFVRFQTGVRVFYGPEWLRVLLWSHILEPALVSGISMLPDSDILGRSVAYCFTVLVCSYCSAMKPNTFHQVLPSIGNYFGQHDSYAGPGGKPWNVAARIRCCSESLASQPAVASDALRASIISNSSVPTILTQLWYRMPPVYLQMLLMLFVMI